MKIKLKKGDQYEIKINRYRTTHQYQGFTLFFFVVVFF